MVDAETPLDQVARNVVQRYLGVTAEDRFLLVGDDDTDPAILHALEAAAREMGCDTTRANIAPRQSSGEEPPASVAAAMAASTFTLC